MTLQQRTELAQAAAAAIKRGWIKPGKQDTMRHTLLVAKTDQPENPRPLFSSQQEEQKFRADFYAKLRPKMEKPDFIIAADGGVTYYIECKSRTGKLRPEQAATIAALQKLGQRVSLVTSMIEFMEVVG